MKMDEMEVNIIYLQNDFLVRGWASLCIIGFKDFLQQRKLRKKSCSKNLIR